MEHRLKIHLAPMQGITEAPFRNLFDAHFGGVETYYTPFVRLEHDGIRRKDLRDLDPERNHVAALVPQLLAGSPEEAETLLSQVVPMGYRHIDLNLGCAFPAVARKGKGCGLLPHPERVEALLQVTERHPELSFSVKMRLGYEDPAECLSLLPALNAARLTHVTVHARTGKQQYGGTCDHPAFKRFAESCIHPTVYNGDIATSVDCARLAAEMPFLAGVMIGRALAATPWLAAEYRDGAAWDGAKRQSRMKDFHADLFDHYARTLEGGEKQLLAKMKSFWEYLLPDADRKLRKRIHKAQTAPAYADAVSALLCATP